MLAKVSELVLPAIESLVQPQLHHTQDNAEGAAAFREKRPPKFVGR